MPLYRYHCETCDESFEQIESTSAVATKVRCPKCGDPKVSRAFGLPAKPTPAVATNCRGDGPPCGAAFCGRKSD